MEGIARYKELIQILNQAAKAYYQEDSEVMSNFEYDKLYDELLQLEEQLNLVLPNSPSRNVGYEVLGELTKVTHEQPMLSLNKTKEVSELAAFIQDKEGVLSWKLDGLTTVLTYEQGELALAVTRGNGVVGEDITHNAKTFANVPLKIPYKQKLIVRGESVIKYSDFVKINDQIEDVDSKYKNPRNLCSGTVRQLNSEICAKRNVHFFAFSVVTVEEESMNTIESRFQWLDSLGFDVVEYKMVNKESMADTVKWFSQTIEKNDFPSDGLVLSFDDVVYGRSLGTTAKFPRNAIAFKWADECATTHLLEVEWSPSRTGLINPVAIFEPVELEGTTVTRASIHNISIMETLELGVGDEISVYKANMIIPQIAENFTKSNTVIPPHNCPVCQKDTVIRKENDVKVLMCVNDQCPVKHVKAFALFASRDALNIDGLSEATLEKFIQHGFLHELKDLFILNQYKDQIIALDGFGIKSYDKLMDAIEKSRNVTLPAFLYGLGISGIGVANAKLICKDMNDDFDTIRTATVEDFIAIDGIGDSMASALVEYFSKTENEQKIDDLLQFITFEKVAVEEANAFIQDKTFVITGTVTQFANRKELKEYIEQRGGKVAGSVSKNTDFLINNDNTSNSSKNKKAKELGIPILTEQEFKEREML